MELLLATTNLHKVREIREILRDIPHLEILSLNNFPEYVAPEETGKTFEENAILKAQYAAKVTGHLTLADDSGLVVPALNGEPGVYSARYAGPKATDKDNRKKLLAAMASLTDLQRSAYFECAMAIADPDGIIKCERGICEGTILGEERGGNGFGYDPLFLKRDYQKTFGELDEATKNRVSHRRKALDRIKIALEAHLGKVYR